MSVAVEREQILQIVQEVFSAMLDQGEERVRELVGDAPTLLSPVSAYVDMFAQTDLGDLNARALLRTESATAHEIARDLLMLTADEEVTPEDLVDAFGEIANVVGGNVKALIDAPASLSLPHVSTPEVDMTGSVFVQDLDLLWRGQSLSVSLWLLN
ncbi:chemotaxis protein CheX [Jonesiaceae bacterium BS-20]|uniref:Chemotaxis protein CheX n=1 Tax=Jonesiaceae bacterium BS-20 TaxID=3120821 RepID=A0AAU7DVX5_9MICO